MSLPFGERERCIKKGYNQWRKHRWVWDGARRLDTCANCGALKRENGTYVRGKYENLMQPGYSKHKHERRRDE